MLRRAKDESKRWVPSETVRPRSALEELEAFMSERRKGSSSGADFAAFERALHERVMRVERELVAEELERADVDAEAVEIDGEVYRRAVRSRGHYQSAAGVVQVERTLYRKRQGGGAAKSISALDQKVGIVEGRWTPLAARQAAWVVTHLSPAEGAELLQKMGNMSPSKSSLQRLPQALHTEWESDRTGHEQELLGAEHVPDEATTVAISLDGVMAPMRDTDAKQKREQTAAEGRLTRGSTGYREVGCGTLSFYDAQAQLLRTVRLARMPESNKKTLKSMLTCELGRALAERPQLRLVALADGAKDNWSYLQDEVLAVLPETESKVAILDFFHALEHISAAFGAAYGDGSVPARNKFDTYRRILLEDPQGVEKTLRALVRLQKRMPGKTKITTVVKYLRTHRHMMRYADYRAAGLPIGSGVVEAACKTLVTQRLKRSGMRWSQQGGQAILNLPSWAQSERFERAWALLAAKYKADVHILANVVPIHMPA